MDHFQLFLRQCSIVRLFFFILAATASSQERFDILGLHPLFRYSSQSLAAFSRSLSLRKVGLSADFLSPKAPVALSTAFWRRSVVLRRKSRRSVVLRRKSVLECEGYRSCSILQTLILWAVSNPLSSSEPASSQPCVGLHYAVVTPRNLWLALYSE